MYFVRIDYIYKGSPVQRARMLASSLTRAYKAVRSYVGSDYLLLSVKIERCA